MTSIYNRIEIKIIYPKHQTSLQYCVHQDQEQNRYDNFLYMEAENQVACYFLHQ